MTNAVLLDVDGVLTVSWKALPGARETIDGLRSASMPFLLLTNTTMKTRKQLAGALNDGGIEVDEREIVTALTATAAYLREKHQGARCFLLGASDVSEELEGIEIVEEGADVVVTAGAEETFTYERLNKAFNLLRDGAPLVAMHRSLYWVTDEGLKLDAGAFVKALEEAADVEAKVVGKPDPEFFRSALAMLNAVPEDAAMVGDDIENDVLAAQRIGLTGIQVRTGKFHPDDLERASAEPDHVIDSIADLPTLLGLK
jgi:HAD superfamily hydrolase (TIGR01458 family)